LNLKFVRVQRAAPPPPSAPPKPRDNAPDERAPRTWGLTLGSWFTPPASRQDRR